jgi:ornithine cyclodeaminase/alanine dehydrogenase-like protein (mu-crystallin family)
MRKAAGKTKRRTKSVPAKRKTVAKVAKKPANKQARKSVADGALYLTEADVQRLVTVKDAMAVLEKLFATWPDPGTVNLPRQRAQIGGGALNLMGAAWGARQLYGLKVYCATGAGSRFHVLLYSVKGPRLLAMIEADHLGRMRTGAASGIATKLLAKPEARTLGVIGGGRQALTQVAAVCAARPIDNVLVFSRTPSPREDFAREIERKLKVAAKPVSTGEVAVADADVIITITTSAEPVLRANWLKSGVHLNVAGANAAARREVDGETVLRATVRATDQVAQAQVEAGEYRELVAAGRLKWHDIVELGDIASGKVAGRRGPADITLFKSLGIALEDIAFAELIYRRATERGVGARMP